MGSCSSTVEIVAIFVSFKNSSKNPLIGVIGKTRQCVMMFNFTSLFFHINAYSLFLCFVLQLTQVGCSDLVVMDVGGGDGRVQWCWWWWKRRKEEGRR